MGELMVGSIGLEFRLPNKAYIGPLNQDRRSHHHDHLFGLQKYVQLGQISITSFKIQSAFP